MLMANQQAAELTEPSVGSFHDPTALVAAECASIFVPPFLVVVAVRHNQFNASPLQPLAVDRNRSRDPQSRGRAFAVAGLSTGGRGLRRAWLPQA
jgi:hypothetical protein